MKFLAKTARELAYKSRNKDYVKRLNEIYNEIKREASVGVTHIPIYIADLSPVAQEKILADLRESGYRIIGPMTNRTYVVRWTL